MLTLLIGNKNYSSWSMRPWVAMRHFGIPFSEEKIRFDSFEPDSEFNKRIQTAYSGATVPVLKQGDFVVGDSLAILEYLADYYPAHNWWPQKPQARAKARELCARMHSGFSHLRRFCPMNAEADLPDVGALIWRDQVGVREDVAMLINEWEQCLAQYGGSMLFGEFTIADAFFAPVCLRFQTYHLPASPTIEAYIQRLLTLPAVSQWIDEAKAEQDFRDFEEPYRLQRY